MTEDHLREIFGFFGQVRTVELQLDRVSGLSKCYAYIEYETKEDAEKGRSYMDGGQIDGKVVVVEYQQQRPPARPGRLPPPPPAGRRFSPGRRW